MKTLLLALAIPMVLLSCKEEPAMPAAPAVSADRAKDPICGMMVDKGRALKSTHDGADYFFCAENCQKKFLSEPAKHAPKCSCVNMKRACACDHCGGKEPCDCVR
jgi:YHS domain-containing protein